MAKILEIVHHSERVYEIRVENPGLRFQPGDCTLLVDLDGVTARPYCIASHPSDSTLRFLIRRFQGGLLSESLLRRKPGDELIVGPCFGRFHPAETASKVFVATGTGVAPFLSYLKDPLAPAPLAFYYGVKHLSDAVEWEWLRQRCPRMTLALSAEKSEPHHHGRITDLTNQFPRYADTHYYLCGLEGMIREVSAALQLLGVHPGQIHKESFFPS